MPQDDPRPTRTRYIVLAFLCAAAALSYMPRNSIGVMQQAIRDDLDISEQAMGWVMGAFFIAYAVFQIPSGLIGHRWGSRRALGVISAAWSASALWMGQATSFASLYLSRLSMGAAQAGVFPSAMNTISKWMPDTQRAMASGSLGAFMSIGGALATALTGVLLEGVSWPGSGSPAIRLSWRQVTLLFSLPGFLWGLSFYLWFRDLPENHRSVSAAELETIRRGQADAAWQAAPQPVPWLALLASVEMWLICGQQFFRAAGYMFYSTWFPTFLEMTRGVSTSRAGFLSSMPLMAVVLGAYLGGLLSDWILARTRSRRLARQALAAGSLSASALLLFLAYFVPSAEGAVCIISAGSFCASLAGPAAYTITIDVGGRQVATVFSTMNMAGNIGAALLPRLVIAFKDYLQSWNAVLFLCTGIHLAAAACWLLLNPNRNIFPEHRDTREERTR